MCATPENVQVLAERTGSTGAGPAGEARPSRRGATWGVVALVALAAAVWLPGLSGPYQFDDYVTPLNDPASQSLPAWAGHLTVTLRPLSKLTYALEAQAGLSDVPAARRGVSVALHAAAATLLFLLIRRLEPRLTWFGASLIAATWLVHPLHAESVLAVSGRTAVLSGLLLIGALLAFERGRRLIAGALFLLACLSRETALAGLLPLTVLAACRAGAGPRARVRAAIPLLVAGAAALLWCLDTPRYLHLAEFSFLGRPWWRSFANQVGAVPVGIGLLVQPSRLSIDYGIPLPGSVTDPLFLIGLLAYAAAAAGVVLLASRSRTAAVGLAVWLAALLPTQSIVPKLDPLSNRPLSLALAGLLVALVPVFAGAISRLASPWLARGTGACAVTLVAALAISAVDRGHLYRSEATLWGDAASKSRSNARPHVVYAMVLKQEGRDREAWNELVAARAIDPFSSGIAALWSSYRLKEDEP